MQNIELLFLNCESHRQGHQSSLFKLLMRPAAIGKKLFLWCEVLVPPARGKSLKESMSRVGGVGDNLNCTSQSLGNIQVL